MGDLYPTTSELAGAPVDTAEESVEGNSYAALFRADGPTTWSNPWNASFTQYPRCCSIAPDNCKRCANVDKSEFSHMGYSMRTASWRYTEWAVWNGAKLSPEWVADPTAPSALTELYDHRADTGTGPETWNDFENENVAGGNPDIVSALSARLRNFFA